MPLTAQVRGSGYVAQMSLSAADCLAAITRYSGAFADAAEGNLAARVEHCPGWDVADLVHHLTDVHWFWGTIAEGTLDAPPEESGHPARAADADLVDTFRAGAARLVEILRAADQTSACWTWFPDQQDVAFITRHQVQEAAVHAWDAVHAAGGTLDLDPVVASDSVDEFVTVSLPDEDDAERERLAALDGPLVLAADDTGDVWRVEDGAVPGSMLGSRGAVTLTPHLSAPAAELLLWLYERVEIDLGDAPRDLVTRFRGGTSTD